MVHDVLDKPVPIIFAVCQGWQQLKNDTWNFLSIFDRMIVRPLPDGTLPDSVTVPVVTSWTGASGSFEQWLQVLDADANKVGEARTPFVLPSTSSRHNIITVMALPPVAGVYTLTVGRPDYEVLLRQDFTLQVAGGPPDQ
jgi:hypothetical protein